MKFIAPLLVCLFATPFVATAEDMPFDSIGACVQHSDDVALNSAQKETGMSCRLYSTDVLNKIITSTMQVEVVMRCRDLTGGPEVRRKYKIETTPHFLSGAGDDCEPTSILGAF